jgi:hypothetical protein
MKKTYLYFLPQSITKLLVWLGSYKSKIVTQGPNVGLSAADVTEQEEAAQHLMDAIQLVDTKVKELDSARSALTVCKQTELKKIIQKTGVIKRHVNYNETIGSELGIIGTAQQIDLETARPALKLSVFPGSVEISFQLLGMRGISIYSRMKGTLGWERITHDYESPYVDTRPLAQTNTPEIREYMARFFNGREDIGRESDVAVCVYGG